MTPEQRLSNLEQAMLQLNSSYQEATGLMQYLGGGERVFQAALLAMIESHPDKALFRQRMTYNAERALSAVLGDAQSEQHLQGAQDAHTLILAALDMP